MAVVLGKLSGGQRRREKSVKNHQIILALPREAAPHFSNEKNIANEVIGLISLV